MKLLVASIALIIAMAATGARAVVVTLCDSDDQAGPGTNLTSAIHQGGLITFACAGHPSLSVTHSHAIEKFTEIDGGTSGMTLRVTGGFPGGALLFSDGVSLAIRNLTLIGNGRGSALYALFTPLSVDNVDISKFGLGITSSAALMNMTNSNFSSLDWGIEVHSDSVLNISVTSFRNIRFSPMRIFGGTVTIDNTSVAESGQSTIEPEGRTPCSVTIKHTNFLHNAAPNGQGGALFLRCDAQLEQLRFEENTAARGGGAIQIGDGAAEVTLRGVKFIENVSAASGGAIEIVHNDAAKGLRVQMQYMSFLRNRATNVGGAIYYHGTRAARLVGAELLFDGNSAREGGAVWWPVGVVDIDRGIFKGNRAQRVGGGIVHFGAFGPSALSNCLMVGNNAAGGGAIHGRGMRLINCTIIGNSGPAVQGAKYPNPTLARLPPNSAADFQIAFVNSILTGNTGANCGGRGEVSFVNQGHNLQFPDTSCGGSIPVADAKLDSMFVPAYFSPAFQAGDNAVCNQPPVRNRDVYGQPRPQGPVCTIGAVEGELQQVLYRRRFYGKESRVPQWWDWVVMFGRRCCD